MDVKDFIKEKTNEAVKDYTESIDDNIRDVLTSGTTVNYANTARTSEIPSTDTLSIEDIQKAMHSLREAERIRQKYITKKVSSPGYQDTVNECVRIIEWLWKKKI